MERVQVRVAALAERLGGFGTCAPGTWSPQAHTHGHSRLIPHANRDGPEPGTGPNYPSAKIPTMSRLGRLKPTAGVQYTGIGTLHGS